MLYRVGVVINGRPTSAEERHIQYIQFICNRALSIANISFNKFVGTIDWISSIDRS